MDSMVSIRRGSLLTGMLCLRAGNEAAAVMVKEQDIHSGTPVLCLA